MYSKVGEKSIKLYFEIEEIKKETEQKAKSKMSSYSPSQNSSE